MTLEERAEEYESKLYGKDCTVKSSCGRKKIYHTDVYYAYIAGAKDNNVPTKWHFVKDELPKEEGEYLVCYQTIAGGRNVFLLKYEEYYGDLHWIDDECETFDEGVIAWQPLPPIPTER